MNFWGNLLEHFKSNSACLFVPALLSFFGLVIGIGIIYDKVPPEIFFGGLIGIGVFALAMVVLRARRRARKHSRHNLSPLSRDEMNKTRSKLGKTKI
jgi:hypothetical protein